MFRHPLHRAAAALALAACSSTPYALDASALTRLRSARSAGGDLVYVGQVVPVGASEPTFRYERRVAPDEDRDDTWVSTHLTFPTGSNRVVLQQRAVHSPTYELRRFEEIHGQTGVVSSVSVRADRSLRFELTRGEETLVRSEAPGAPVVVGPTLFGYVLEHWDELLAGTPLNVRFAAADLGRSYGFTLRLVATTSETTTVSMSADDFFVRLGVAPMEIVFDTTSRRVVRYTGRVPPRLAGLRSFDARVDYEFAASTFR